MTFAEILSQYLNRNLEVYLPNQFLEGVLQAVNGSSFVLEVQNGSYVDPSDLVTIFLDNVEGIRVLTV
ncbi:hypothetical protein ACFVAD_15330 [Sutcliffiella sp. NPDC057660]|uniref:hypothetical protein n=1 Tax=Sutcliffiella sp. NPDC057660 TaxID=3346199 RepID=UPI0036AE7BE7